MYSFYRSPYEFNNDLQKIKLHGRFVSDKFIGSPDIFDIEYDMSNIHIDLIDKAGVHYSSSGSYYKEETSNDVYFQIGGNFPIERINDVITIVVTDKKNNINHEIKIQPKFVAKRYNFFSKNLNGIILVCKFKEQIEGV